MLPVMHTHKIIVAWRLELGRRRYFRSVSVFGILLVEMAVSTGPYTHYNAIHQAPPPSLSYAPRDRSTSGQPPPSLMTSNVWLYCACAGTTCDLLRQLPLYGSRNFHTNTKKTTFGPDSLDRGLKT